MSPGSTSPPLVLRLLRSAAGIVAIALLLVFALWLLRHLYLDETWQQEMVRRYSGTHTIAQTPEPVSPEWDRFHVEVPAALASMPNPPVCDSCHSSHPHHESERLRAYLNMHTTFLACETCHHRPAPGEAIEHAWVDDEDDRITHRPAGEHGVYGAHVYPARRSETGMRRLGRRLSEPEWRAFSERVATAGGPEYNALTDRAHGELQGDPFSCGECHRLEGVLDGGTLDYTPNEIERLAQLEIARFLESDSDFHLPDMGGLITPVPASP